MRRLKRTPEQISEYEIKNGGKIDLNRKLVSVLKLLAHLMLVTCVVLIYLRFYQKMEIPLLLIAAFLLVTGFLNVKLFGDRKKNDLLSAWKIERETESRADDVSGTSEGSVADSEKASVISETDGEADDKTENITETGTEGERLPSGDHVVNRSDAGTGSAGVRS